MTASRAKRPAASPIVVDAIRIDPSEAGSVGFTYTVLIDADPRPPRPAVAGERRDAPRRRTRLRSGKIVDARGRFVTECVVHDLSVTGVRLRLPEGLRLPTGFQVYDDQSGLLHNATVSWQREGEAGVHFVALADSPRDHVIAADMRRKYYKMPR